MATDLRALKIFIASPSDVAAERQIAENVIRGVDYTFREMFGITIEVIKWENKTPLTHLTTKISLQEEINEEVKRCDIFLLMLYKRIGTKEEGYEKANTQREIDIILQRIERNERIMLLTYFRQLKENEDPGFQEKEVRELRENLDRHQIWHSEYSDIYDFERKLTHHVYQTILKFLWETTKQKATRNFWQFGEADRPATTRLAIVYPPIDRSYTERHDPDRYWHNRLAPNIVFEDYKALQKIQKSLGLIGLRDYRIYTTSNIPKDIQYMNRIWICLPRNPGSINQLKNYQKSGQSVFDVMPRTSKKHAHIIWKNSSNNGESFIVKSPLNLYLEHQRGKEMMGGEWRAEMEQIVAKDYAILARFQDKSAYIDMKAGSLYDYFFAGIRGLGTWGAAWFLDRRSKTLLEYEPHMDIQLLLEIIYWDGRILEVTDVSDKPSSYFQSQLHISTVKETVRDIGLF